MNKFPQAPEYTIRTVPNLFLENVPADPLPPEPERFFGRERSFVPNYPSPHPQHLAEGLPDLCQWRPDGLVPIYLRYQDCIWCKKEMVCTGWDWYNLKYTRNTMRYISNAGGWDGIFFSCLLTPPFLNRWLSLNRSSRISLWVWNRGDAIMHYMDTTTCNKF